MTVRTIDPAQVLSLEEHLAKATALDDEEAVGVAGVGGDEDRFFESASDQVEGGGTGAAAAERQQQRP